MKFTLSSITSGLVGGLVLSCALFMGYVLVAAQQSHSPPVQISTIGCFSLGHCQMSLSTSPN
jgi:hypothetical protein